MNIIKKEEKCVVCGYKSHQEDVLSYSCFDYCDFDQKPSFRMFKPSSLIKECPNCHYCHYALDQALSFEINKFEDWQNNEEINKLISITDSNVRKTLILSKQYEQIGNNYRAYKLLIEATWYLADEELINKLRKGAYELYKKSLKEGCEDFIQMADVLRMDKEFEEAIKIIEKVKELLINEELEYSNLKKIMVKEEELIINKDFKRHNLDEIFKKIKR